jgi:CRISPR-associated protein Cas5t
LDSTEEEQEGERLEARVRRALTDPSSVERFGGLSLGESSHLVDVVRLQGPEPGRQGQAYLLAERGRLTLPVWVDHVGSAGTRYVTGDLVEGPLVEPDRSLLSRIEPKESRR